MVGGTALAPKRPNPSTFLTDKMWANIIDMSDTLPAFQGLDQHIEYNLDKWDKVFQANEPYLSENWPHEWVKQLNAFQRLLLIRICRMDKLIPAIQNMIIDQMDPFFVEFPPFNL